jgi:hypothetical protein
MSLLVLVFEIQALEYLLELIGISVEIDAFEHSRKQTNSSTYAARQVSAVGQEKNGQEEDLKQC